MDRLSMRKISEVLRQRLELKCSYREIARSLNISTSTITDYLARARASGVSWPLPVDLTEQELYDKLFLPVSAARADRPHPDWDVIHRELRKKGMTLQLLWREYRDAHPLGLGYSQFCNYYQRFTKAITPVMRQAHKAGEKSFVDYAGMKMPWFNPVTGEIHEAEIFVGCLGASQFIFIEATATKYRPKRQSKRQTRLNSMLSKANAVMPWCQGQLLAKTGRAATVEITSSATTIS